MSWSNGHAPSVWWYLFRFSSIITFSSGILSVNSSVILLVCCWLTRVVPDLLNLPSMYFSVWIECGLLLLFSYCVHAWLMDLFLSLQVHWRGWYGILCSGPLPVFLNAFLPEYADWSPVIISVLLTFDVTCVNFRYSWVVFRPLWWCSFYRLFSITQSSTKSIVYLYFGDHFTQPVILLLHFYLLYA